MTLRKLAPVLLTGLLLLPGLSSEARADPDLKVEIIAVEEGSPGTITVVVRNDGDSTARAAKVGVIITAGTAAIRVASPTRKLPEGKSATIAIPALLVPGLQLQAIADPEETIEESDESNNASALWQVERSGRELVLVPVAPTEPEAQQEEEQPAEETAEAEETEEEQPAAEPEVVEPELIEEVLPPPLRQPDLTLKVTEVKAGENGRVVVEVANRGITAAPRSRIVLLINADGQRSEVEAVVPKLGPDARASVEIPAMLWGGARFQVMVDPRNELAEADESNNRTPVQSVQGESAPPQTVTTVPDLATEILSVDPGPPLRVRAIVRNLGSLTSTASIVTLTLASGATLSQDVPPLRPGQSLEVVFEAGQPEGLVVMVDPGLAIAESDETNNRSDAALPAQPAPTPVAPTPVSPTTPMDGAIWLLGGTPVLIVPEVLEGDREIPGYRPDAPARRVAALVLPDGTALRFVENQLAFTGEEAEAIALAERYGGEIVHTISRPAATGRHATYVIALDAGAVANLPPRGASEAAPTLVSSLAALHLLGVVLQEQDAGLAVSIDPVLELNDAFSGKTIEAQGSNSSDWSYLKKGGPLDVNVVGAWQLLAIADRAPHGLKVALIDTGFGTEPDLPPYTGTTGLYSAKNAAEGKAFHGAAVASAIGAIADNGIGAAGPAGSFVNLLYLQRTHTSSDSIANLWAAASQGAWIINMSHSSYNVRGQDIFTTYPDVVIQFEKDAVFLFESGLLLFASASNEGWSVDQLDGDGNEFSWINPCESQGVICVGGWRDDATRAYDSNYGEGRGETVDIYGPYYVFGGPDPMSPSPNTLQPMEGTSFASPFVAGVAALVWTANPSLTNVQVWDLLRSNVTLGKDGIPMVNAYRPVRQALMMLGGNHAPHVQVMVPESGFAAAKQFEPLRLAVDVVDVEDAEACCAIAWVSDMDGPLGTGTSIEIPFDGKATGTRLVTVTATDSAGLTGQAVFTVDYSNSGPRLVLVQPADGATLYSDLDYAFRAELHDDTVKLDLPLTDCTGVTWSSANPADPVPLAKGCTPTVHFGSAGTRTLTVGYTDAYGASGSEHATVTVFEPGGAGSAPIALAITSPTEGSAYNVETRIPLSYQLKDPGAGGTKPNYQVAWRLGRDSTDMRVFTPLKDAQGQYIRIVDVFPERRHDGTSGGYTLHLMMSDPTRPGSTSGTAVHIAFLPALK